MPLSPLNATHEAAGARLDEFEGWTLPLEFATGAAAEARAIRTAAGLADRSFAGVVSLAGPDARRFCNGMFTNNIRALAVGGGNRSAMVDDKARIQGLLDLYCVAPESFLAVLDGVTHEAFEARYGKYIIFDDVEMEDRSEELGVLSVQGPDAEAVLARAGLPVPSAVHEGAGEIRVARCPRSPAGGFDLLAPRAGLGALWDRLRDAGALPAGTQAQEIARIEAGIPRWPVDMGERSLIHELRLVPRCGSFDKGCYIGQEVINRIDVMGQVTRKIWGLDVRGDEVPARGTEVRLGEEGVGTVLSGASEEGRVRVLAMLRKAAWTAGLEVSLPGAVAVVSDLPFGS